MSVFNCCSGCSVPKNQEDKSWCWCARKDGEYERRFDSNLEKLHKAVVAKLEPALSAPDRRFRVKRVSLA